MNDVLGEALQKLTARASFADKRPEPQSASAEIFATDVVSPEAVGSSVADLQIVEFRQAEPPAAESHAVEADEADHDSVSVTTIVEPELVSHETTEPLPSVALFAAAAEHVTVASVAAESAANEHAAIEHAVIDSPDAVQETVEVSTVEAPTASSAVVSDRTSKWSRLSSRLLANRRQTAAVIVLLVMGYLWVEDNRNTPSPSWDGNTDIDFSDVDSMASAFDTMDAQPTREPAEPIGQSSDSDFPLTIPQANEAQMSGFGSGNSNSSAIAVYPDDAASMANQASEQFTIPNMSGSSNNSGRPNPGKRVRLTGKIQRAN